MQTKKPSICFVEDSKGEISILQDSVTVGVVVTSEKKKPSYKLTLHGEVANIELQFVTKKAAKAYVVEEWFSEEAVAAREYTAKPTLTKKQVMHLSPGDFIEVKWRETSNSVVMLLEKPYGVSADISLRTLNSDFHCSYCVMSSQVVGVVKGRQDIFQNLFRVRS
jgi:hypothetical protein